MNEFETAILAARVIARGLIAEEIDPTTIADAMITEALAAWAARTGRQDDAEGLLAVWTSTRDS